MKKIVFGLVTLVGLLSASEYVEVSRYDVVTVKLNSKIVKVFKISDIAYMTNMGTRNIVVLKQPANSIIDIENNDNQHIIAEKFVKYLESKN